MFVSDLSKHSDPPHCYTSAKTSRFDTLDARTNQPSNSQPPSLFTSSTFTYPYTTKPNQNVTSGRFIPIRYRPPSMNFWMSKESFSLDVFSQNQREYMSLVEDHFLKHKDSNLLSISHKDDIYRSRYSKPQLLNFVIRAKKDKNVISNTIASFVEFVAEKSSIKETRKAFRKIGETPYKILDAPGLCDDYNVHLMHWSSKNYLAVSLGHSVWIMNVDSERVNKLCEAINPLEEVTSVQWDDRNNVLALGDIEGNLNLWDFEASRKIRTLSGHTDRVNCITWNGNNIISTASRDRMIYTRDLRAPNDYVLKHVGHKDEVCGLKWSPSGKFLASGGNDKTVFVWRLHKTESEMKFDKHTIGVRAMAWSPHDEELLLTGDNTRINMWNVLSAKKINGIETETQVCNILFSKNSNEFVTTHGYPKNQIVVWNYPNLNKYVLDSTESHSERILFLSDSPDGENIATGASDETVRFWNIFEKRPSKEASIFSPSISNMR